MSALLAETKIERRKHQRVSVNLAGRFMMPDKKEYPCQIAEMSPGDMVLYTPVTGNIGDHIVVYVDVMGRLSGNVARLFDGGFAIKFKVSPLKQDRLAEKLTWIINKDNNGSLDDRRHERLHPDNPASHLTLPDGRSYECKIIDISVSGAAVTSSVCPDIHTHITLGKTRGKVVRHLAEGFAIEFTAASPNQGII